MIVDNLGGDEFSEFTGHDMSADPRFWAGLGFALEVVETGFAFDDLEQARTLLEFYFGERGRDEARLTIEYRVGLFVGAGGRRGG